METDPTRMCARLVGLPEVSVLGVDDRLGEPIIVHVEQAGERPWCHVCGGPSRVKDRDEVVLVDPKHEPSPRMSPAGIPIRWQP